MSLSDLQNASPDLKLFITNTFYNRYSNVLNVFKFALFFQLGYNFSKGDKQLVDLLMKGGVDAISMSAQTFEKRVNTIPS